MAKHDVYIQIVHFAYLPSAVLILFVHVNCETTQVTDIVFDRSLMILVMLMMLCMN